LCAKHTLRVVVPVLILIAVVGFFGCAKRPALTQASAPAPTAAMAPPPPAAAAPAQEAPAASPPAPIAAAAPTPPAPKDFADEAALKDIHFDFDRSNIRADAATTLDSHVEWLRSHANMIVLVEGHCDERGTNEYNLALGERRTRAAINYLIARGIASDRFTSVSYGEERPLCTEHNEECWAKNRRAHFKVKER